MLVTDFTMIRPGSLHTANGGYLIIDARKLFSEPFSWEGLKRVLTTKSIKIESIAQRYSFISTATLEPEPIPLDIKIVLIGERILYYLLHQYDPEFKELFKVVADFEDDLPRNDDNVKLYAQLIASLAQKNTLLPLNKKAVGRLVEFASRHAQDASKLSTHLGTLSDLLKEADYHAKKMERKVIDIEDINTTLKAQVRRQDRMQTRMYEQIDRGTIIISTQGEAIGQVNGLAVLQLGPYRFATPARITAVTRMGKGDIINIDRNVDLSGSIHSKGVLILSSLLSSKYAYDIPLSLWVSLAFEQSYGKIDGDSASSAELYAILSSLSKLPIKQNFAVTGSVNQFGEIQAIGGVNEKIEGYFDLTQKIDPDQEYAVLIPQSNVKHLMLKDEVLEAVKAKKFAVYAVSTVDEGISILTGVTAGSLNSKGEYPKNSVNGKVIQQLKAFTQAAIDAQRKAKLPANKKK
ncbi:MAG: AAA family ATPase, partial [Thiovulaceae bacterium]|nr:AAA family ATPase [Sulfurimonadaceae bacterium]